MSSNWTDRDIDALLSGKAPADRDLAALTPHVARVRAGFAVQVTEEQANAIGARLAAATEAPNAAVAPARRAWVRRLSLAGLGAVLLGAGVAGTAAADTSAPGDSFYGLDRALEAIGIHNGGFAERLDEAKQLVEEGDDDAAMDLLADSMDDADADGKAALLAAAEKIRENGSAQSADVHQAVADMLEWMATTDATGKEFGQGVAEHARAINGKPSTEGTEDPTGTDDETGKPEDAGPPATPGEPDDAGKPSDAGKPTDAGKPDGAGGGKPEGSGKP